jgi:hypothetical protein
LTNFNNYANLFSVLMNFLLLEVKGFCTNMSSINKHRVPAFVATELASKLYPDSQTLLSFVYYGAAADKIAWRTSGETRDFFPDLVLDVLKKKEKKVTKESLTELAQEIVESAKTNSKVKGDIEETKEFLTRVMTDVFLREFENDLMIKL